MINSTMSLTPYSRMPDNSESLGTWVINYAFDSMGGGHTPVTGGGSVRFNVLPIGAYNQIMWFWVARTSSPTSMVSDWYSTFVGEVTL